MSAKAIKCKNREMPYLYGNVSSKNLLRATLNPNKQTEPIMGSRPREKRSIALLLMVSELA